MDLCCLYIILKFMSISKRKKNKKVALSKVKKVCISARLFSNNFRGKYNTYFATNNKKKNTKCKIVSIPLALPFDARSDSFSVSVEMRRGTALLLRRKILRLYGLRKRNWLLAFKPVSLFLKCFYSI